MRDQLIALSYAAAISGLLLLILEKLILDDATFWQTFPYMFVPFALGVAGLYWFRFRKSESTETKTEPANKILPPTIN